MLQIGCSPYLFSQIDSSLVARWNQQAGAFYAQSPPNFDSTIWYLQRVHQHADAQKDTAYLINARRILGLYYRQWARASVNPLLAGQDSAVVYFQAALDLAGKFYGKKHRTYARHLSDLATEQYYYGGHFLQYAEVLYQLLEIELAQKPLDWQALNDAYYSLALTLKRVGDFEEARRYYQRCEDIQQTHGPDLGYGATMPMIWYEWGRCYEAEGELLQSIRVRKKGLSQIDGYVFGYQQAYKVGFFHDIALSFLKLGEPDSCQKYLEMVRPQIAPEAAYQWATHRYIQAEWALKTGAADQALSLAQEALPEIIFRFSKTKGHPILAQAYDLMGRCEVANAREKRALPFFMDAIRVLAEQAVTGEAGDLPPLDSLKASPFTVEFLQNYGRAMHQQYLRTGDLEALTQAFQAFELGRNLIPAIRNSLYSEGARVFFSQKLLPFLEDGITCALALARHTGDDSFLAQAFEMAELSRLSVLFDNLQQVSASQQTHIPRELQNEERSLRAEISFVEQKLALQSEESASGKKWRDQLFSLKETRKKLLKDLEASYPSYFRLRYDTETASFSDVQALLKTKEAALFQYFWGKDTLYAFVLNGTGIQVKRVAQAELANPLKDFRTRLSQGAPGGKDPFTSLAHQLYTLLVPEDPHFVQAPLWIICPDGLLGYLPMEALLSAPVSDPRAFRDMPFVVKDHALQYIFSTTILLGNSSVEGEPSIPYLGFAPTYGPLRGAGPVSSTSRSSLGPLSFNQEEVTAVHQLLGGEKLQAKAATEQAFKARASQAGILHLSQHGIIDDLHPLQSALVFTETGEADSLDFSNEAGFLRAYELYHMDLQAELAILSACHSGAGLLQQGEGIMSLARAFRYAGCPDIIMSLWEAEGSAAKEVVIPFVQYLEAGMSRAEAIRQAKLDYLEQAAPSRSDPFFWANLVFIGEDVSRKKSQPWIWWLLGLLLISLTFWSLKRYNQARKA
ncbi:MAG: CHAT domain-containing protein [Bacteroidota bacterium]